MHVNNPGLKASRFLPPSFRSAKRGAFFRRKKRRQKGAPFLLLRKRGGLVKAKGTAIVPLHDCAHSRFGVNREPRPGAPPRSEERGFSHRRRAPMAHRCLQATIAAPGLLSEACELI